MENPVSSIVSRLGAGSGIDMVQLAADLAEVRFSPQVEQLTARNEALEARISAASVLRSQLNQLASALGDRIRTGDLAPAPQISNASVASVGVLPGTRPSGSYSLEVTQLASSQTLVLGAFADNADTVGEGTLSLRFGNIDGANFTADTERTAVDITLDATDTLESLAGKINAADSGITAYVANGTNGAQLVLKGEEGAANGFVIETTSTSATPGAMPGDPTFLAWNPASDAGELRQVAQDAEFLLDTIAISNRSNDIRDSLPEGLTLSLTGTNIGQPAQIGFADTTDRISSVMSDLVAALNDITSELSQSGAALGGVLGADPGTRALKRALSGLSSTIVMPNAGTGEPSTLGDLGLSVNRDGSFRLDSDRLQETLAQNPDGAAAMFTTGLFGVFATLDSLARDTSAVADPGSLAGSVSRYTSQIERNEERLAKIAEQQESLRERMTAQFVAADRNITAFNSTLSFIQSQIAVWNADTN